MLSLSIACSGGDQDEQPASVVPLLAFGQPETILASADPDAELLRAWSATRLSGGSVAPTDRSGEWSAARSSLACAFGIGEGARIGWSEGQAVCAM